MPRKTFSPEQIIALLRQIVVRTNPGQPDSAACREAGIIATSATDYRWRKEYGG